MDLKNLNSAVNQIAEERGIGSKEVLASIEEAIAAAYKKQYREKSEIVKAKFDLKTGSVKFWQVKTVVDETTVRLGETAGQEEENGARAASQERLETKPATAAGPEGAGQASGHARGGGRGAAGRPVPARGAG